MSLLQNDIKIALKRHWEKQMLQEKSLLAARAKKWPCLPILIWLNLGKSKHRRRFFFPFWLLHATSVSRLDWQQRALYYLIYGKRRPIKKWSHIGHKLCTRTRMTTSLAPSILANERKLVDINQERPFVAASEFMKYSQDWQNLIPWQGTIYDFKKEKRSEAEAKKHLNTFLIVQLIEL